MEAEPLWPGIPGTKFIILTPGIQLNFCPQNPTFLFWKSFVSEEASPWVLCVRHCSMTKRQMRAHRFVNPFYQRCVISKQNTSSCEGLSPPHLSSVSAGHCWAQGVLLPERSKWDEIFSRKELYTCAGDGTKVPKTSFASGFPFHPFLGLLPSPMTCMDRRRAGPSDRLRKWPGVCQSCLCCICINVLVKQTGVEKGNTLILSKHWLLVLRFFLAIFDMLTSERLSSACLISREYNIVLPPSQDKRTLHTQGVKHAQGTKKTKKRKNL